MIQQDWLMRQIEMIGAVLAKVLFNKETAQYEFPEAENTNAHDLHKELLALVNAGRVNEAEDRLFEFIGDGSDLSLMEVALDFYIRLNGLSDGRLEDCGFSREEIDEGLRDAARLYGVRLNLEEE